MRAAPFESSKLPDLLANGDGLRLTITLPTHRTGREALADAPRLRQLLESARDRLRDAGEEKERIERLLVPLEETLDDDDFWSHQDRGLALTVEDSQAQAYSLPYDVPEGLFVGNRHAVRWLLPLLERPERFFVLALSVNSARVVEATPGGSRQVDLAEMPTSMEEALGDLQYDTETQVHSGGPASMGRKGGIVHGHGDADADRFEKNLLTYFQRVLAVVQKALPHDVPWVAAAVEGHLPILRRAAGQDDRLLEAAIVGNPDLLSERQLAERAKALVAERPAPARQRALERLAKHAGTPLWSDEISTLVTAAQQGRIDSLFLSSKLPDLWGAFEPDTGALEIHEQPEPGDEDLVDAIAFHTLRTKGAVWQVNGDELPLDAKTGPVIGLLRY